MARYLDPKNDLTFKRIFGGHKHLCMSLINNMLPLDSSIVSIEYQTGELIPEIEVLRNSIVDVRCTDERGRQFIVEMQMYWSESFKSRVLLNASKAYVMQLDKANKYELLQPVYSLNFVNETFEKSPEMRDEYYHHYKIVNIKNTEKQIKGLEFVFIELTKFSPKNRAEQKLHELWRRFLTEINESTSEAPRELLENSETNEAVGYLEIGAYTKEQLFTYDKVRDGILTERSVLSDAKREGVAEGLEKGLERGLAQGLEKGLGQGLAQGLEQGLEKGREEERKKFAAACLKKGMSLEDIQELTGLGVKTIRSLM
jgi:predicted transposase/invertase (TIGR01784 family)